MRKWKYKALVMRDLSIAESKLNAEGDKGWELVSVCLVDGNTARAFFKAPEGAAEAPPADFAADGALAGQSPF
ncbi:MAG: hypothetical protein FJX72_07435 [Armatimonadetes bacterium]|nr:hypothetical protein [Armatimonadota bacterium]